MPGLIEDRRLGILSECRELLIRISGIQKSGELGLLSKGEKCVEGPKNSEQTKSVCDCCQRSDIPEERMSRIESGHLLCPVCMEAFCKASLGESNQMNSD